MSKQGAAASGYPSVQAAPHASCFNSDRLSLIPAAVSVTGRDAKRRWSAFLQICRDEWRGVGGWPLGALGVAEGPSDSLLRL